MINMFLILHSSVYLLKIYVYIYFSLKKKQVSRRKANEYVY